LNDLGLKVLTDALEMLPHLWLEFGPHQIKSYRAFDSRYMECLREVKSFKIIPHRNASSSSSSSSSSSFIIAYSRHSTVKDPKNIFLWDI